MLYFPVYLTRIYFLICLQLVYLILLCPSEWTVNFSVNLCSISYLYFAVFSFCSGGLVILPRPISTTLIKKFSLQQVFPYEDRLKSEISIHTIATSLFFSHVICECRHYFCHFLHLELLRKSELIFSSSETSWCYLEEWGGFRFFGEPALTLF